MKTVCVVFLVFFIKCLNLTSDSESSGGLAVSGYKGHLSGVVGLAVSDCQSVLPEHTANGNAGIWLQLLAVAGPISIRTRMLQLHTKDDSVADGNDCPPGKLLGDVA